MRVLYVSKASVVAAYRTKLRALARHVDLVAVIPERWGSRPIEPIAERDACIETWPVRFHGHNHLHLYRNAARMLEAHRPDLVHIDEEPYSAATFQLTRLCRRRGVPCVFFAWQNLYKRLPPPFGAMRRYVYRHAAAGIAGTASAEAVLRRGGFDGPVAVIPQVGVDTAVFRPSGAADAGAAGGAGGAGGASDAGRGRELVVGFAGRLVAQKGVDVLIDAVSRLEDVALVVVGGGPERGALERRAGRLGIAGRTRFVGHVDSTDMPDRYRAMDVLVLPSRSGRGFVEQFGRVLVEAMACEVPVIGSDSGEIPDVMGDCGIVVPEGDAAALAEAVRRLRDDPELRSRLGARGRERVMGHFTQQRIARDTAALYASLLESAGSP